MSDRARMPLPEVAAEQAVRDEIDRLLRLAGDGEWLRVFPSSLRLRPLLDALPAARRRDALQAACDAVGRVTALATAARDGVGEQLGTLRRGKMAASRYRTTGGSPGRT